MAGVPQRWQHDEQTLAWAAEDWGRLVHHRPSAVVRPESTADIAEIYRYGAARGIPVRPRAQGHSALGQAQARGGIVVDLTGWNQIEQVDSDAVVVAAGARWSDVLAATLPRGLTPPVLTDYLELSVGGTLSAGGIGGATARHGLQTDNVAELEVVTPQGETLTCSATRHRGVFDAVRAGLGRHGSIVRANVRLVPAQPRTTRYKLHYRDLPTFLADQRRLNAEGRFAHLAGQARLDGGRWGYFIEAAQHHTGSLDHHRDTAGLSWYAREVEETTYFDFLNQMAPDVALLRANGHWDRPHPWLDLFLPDSATDHLVDATLRELTAEDIGESGVVLLYPFTTRRISTPAVALPAEPTAFLFALLRTAASPADARRMHGSNEAVRANAVAAGATVYLGEQ